nr:MAG: hypothetical protein [Microviridae sp.]
MYQLAEKPQISGLKVNKGYKGERIEDRVHRMMYSNEAIGDGSPLIYTDRRKGVMPEHDIRTDRFEIALDAMNGVTERNKEKRKSYYEFKKDEPSGEGKKEPSGKPNGSVNDTTK